MPAGSASTTSRRRLVLFHQQVLAEDDLHRAAFEGFYLHRVKPIKRLAAVLGVDRTHVYYLRRQVALRAWRRMQGA